MGSGSSKQTTQVVVAGTSFNAENNNNRPSKGTNAEQHENEGMMDLHTSDGLNVKTLANFTFSHSHVDSDQLLRTNAEQHENEGMMDLPTSDGLNVKTLANFTFPHSHVDSDQLLTSFSSKHPATTENLRVTLKDHYESLKDALGNGNLSSQGTLNQVKGLFNVYVKDKSPKNRTTLTEFAVALGVPELASKIIVDRRKDNHELTTWDREVQKEQTIVEEGRSTSASTENENRIDDKDKTAALELSQDVISLLLAAVLNFSDLNDNFSLACDEAGMVMILVEMTKELQDSISHNVKYVNAETQQLSKYTVRGRMLSRTMGVLHNLSKRVPTRRNFAACQAINVLIPLLKAEVILFSTKSLLVLAYLTDEENNHLIMADEGPIKFLTRSLKKALGQSTHRYMGFSASELAEGLTQIAVNDNNKKTIVQSGAIPILVTMLQKAQGDDERLNACNTLWTLAFDEENKKEITSDKFAIAELRKLLTTENSELKRAASGALWECVGKEKYVEEKQLSVSAQEAADTKHVMISYQWDVQKSMIQLKNQLQAQGYKVWMDIDEMGGSTLESMAKAVENASVVLVGVSQKYKESPNCRSEAEYTYQLHKDIIPLMMDYKYKPDGWLGIIVGTKLWIDFTERHKLDTSAEKLMKELGNRGKIVAQETVQATTVDVVDASPQISIRSWTYTDVISWLKKVGLEGRLHPKAVRRLDGRMLLRLQHLRKESPEFFYTSMRTDFKMASMLDVLEFTDELDKLER